MRSVAQERRGANGSRMRGEERRRGRRGREAGGGAALDCICPSALAFAPWTLTKSWPANSLVPFAATHTHIQTHTHTHAHTHTHTHSPSHTHTHTHTKAQIYPNTNANTHTHTHPASTITFLQLENRRVTGHACVC